MSVNKLRSLQNLLALSAATLIITVWSTVIFLAYQNELLKKYSKELDRKQTPSLETQPGQGNTTNWNVYQNKYYGFEFKYPSYLGSQPLASDDIIVQLGEHFDGGEPGNSSLLVFFINTKPYETVFAQDIKNDGTEIINKETVNIGSHSYTLLTHKQFDVEAAYKIIDYISIKNNKIQNLYLYFSHTSNGCAILPTAEQIKCQQNNDSNIKKYRELRNQILSTFKFIEKKYPEWNYYSNDDFGVYFEYPTDWEIIEKYHAQRGLGKESDLLNINLKSKDHPEDMAGGIRVIDDLSVDDLVKYYSKLFGSENSELISVKDTIFHSIAAKEVIGKNITSNSMYGVLIFEKGDYRFTVPDMTLTNINKSEDEIVFDQILSTFKFIDNDTSYNCPSNGWVNCQPILNIEEQKACSDDAIKWYKSNCSNYQGIAY